MRIVLVGWAEGDWRTYRQPQWMGEVRADPSATARPRRHFDLDESGYAACLADWKGGTAGTSLQAALATLARHGAVEVVREQS